MIKLVILSIIAIGATTLANHCANVPQHYYELGCTAIKDSPDAECPTRFKCPDFSKYLYNKCYYNGDSYEPGENLKSYVSMLCKENCKCSNGTNGASITCDDTMCDENGSDSSVSDDKKCIYQHELGVCCAKKKICGSKLIQELPTCKHNGNTYYKGEVIYPFQTPCYRCLCNENFNNVSDFKFNKRCERVSCGLHLFHKHKFAAGCVPVYDPLNCCPKDDFRCPLLSDKVIPVSSGSSSAATECTGESCCTFGKLSLYTGDKITSPNKNIQCSCDMPPLITCKRLTSYGF